MMHEASSSFGASTRISGIKLNGKLNSTTTTKDGLGATGILSGRIPETTVGTIEQPNVPMRGGRGKIDTQRYGVASSNQSKILGSPTSNTIGNTLQNDVVT